MVSNDLLMQFQSDVTGIPVIRPSMNETTALGAAFAAGLTVRLWRDEAELRALVRNGDRFDPSITEEERTALLREWDKGIQRSLDWV